MVSVYDVPADEFLDELADRLRDHLEEPEWARYAKSGPDREFPPEQPDFWHRRAASVFRRVAMDGPVGVDRLSASYGGGKSGSNRYGFAPVHQVDGSKHIVRTILQQLEESDFVERPPDGHGRIVTPEGQGFLDSTAEDVLEELDRPELERYR